MAIYAKNGAIGRKMAKTKNFGRQKFLIGIDSEWSKMNFRMKIWISKFFPIMTFLRGHSHFSKDWGSYVEKMAETKNFGRKYFLVGIDLEWSKTHFKMKISISKKYSNYDFSLGSAVFSKNGSHSSNHVLEMSQKYPLNFKIFDTS